MNTPICPHCGQVHPAEARFCPATGKILGEKNTCLNCGGPVQPAWKVCPRCGTSLVEVAIERASFFPRKCRTWLIILVASALLILAASFIALEFRPQNPINEGAITPRSATSAVNETAAGAAPSVQLTTIIPTGTVVVSPPISTPATVSPVPASSNPQGKIVFVCQIFKDPERNQICLINPDGSNWRRLSSDDDADHTYPYLAPDGQAIIFSFKKFAIRQIYEMDLSGITRQLSDVPFEAYAPAVSPDNKKIVFTTNSANRQSLWVMNRDGTDLFELTGNNEGEAWDPVWSSDGKQILFASNREGEIQLYMMDADGSNSHRLTNIEGLRGRSDWSTGTQRIATYKGSSWHREIVILGPDGNELEQITDGGNNLAPNFSPDEEWITFTSYRDHFGEDNGCEIYVMRVDGSETLRLTSNDYCDWQPNWGP